MSYKSTHTGSQIDDAVDKVLNNQVGKADWNAKVGEVGYIENKTHFFNPTSTVSKLAWSINNTTSPRTAVISLNGGYIYAFNFSNNTYYIKTDTDEVVDMKILDAGPLSIRYRYTSGNHTLNIQHYTENLTDDFLTIYEASISTAESLSSILKKLDEIFLPNSIAHITDTEEMTSILYADLVNLRDNSKLKPGHQYRIVDYTTTTTQENTQSAGHQFDVIVTADDVNVLNEKARAIQHEGDTYFANSDLNAWEIWYSLDNDIDRFDWASRLSPVSNRKIIMAFAGNNDDDTSSIYVRYPGGDKNGYYAWAYDLDGEDMNINPYIRGGSEDIDFEDILYTTSENPIINDDIYNLYNNNYIKDSRHVEDVRLIESKGVIYRMIDEFGNDCPYDFKNIQFARWELSNPVGYRYSGQNNYWINESTPFNSLKTGFYGIKKSATIFNYNKYKVEYTISESPTYCYTFGKDTDYSIDGSNYSNVIKEYKSSNKIQLNNIVFLKNNCKSNSFGYGCQYNSFGNDCSYNSFGDYTSQNSFGNSCSSNSLGNSCSSNSFGTNCTYNSLGNDNDANNFCDSCQFNSLGNDCDYNSFGNDCDYNSFGNDCDYNSFGNGCKTNSLGNDCDNNCLGNGCTYNSFGNFCRYNSFGESKDNPKSYYRYIMFDNGNSYINLNCTSTTGSSNYYQNVRIGLGVNNTTTYKTITDSNVGQIYQTVYKPANSKDLTA